MSERNNGIARHYDVDDRTLDSIEGRLDRLEDYCAERNLRLRISGGKLYVEPAALPARPENAVLVRELPRVWRV